MANKRNIEIQDHEGNIYNPHTAAKVVFLEDGKNVESQLANMATEVNKKAPSGHTHDYNSISNKPATFPPSNHKHSVVESANGLVRTGDNHYVVVEREEADTKLVMRAGGIGGTRYDSVRVSKADTVEWNGISGKPSGFVPVSHNHNDLYYSKQEVDNLMVNNSAIKSVQRGVSNNPTGNYWVEITISAVDLNKCFINIQGHMFDGAVTQQSTPCTARLINSTTLRLQFSTKINYSAYWEIIEFK